mgnify:CR=1 FL=1
MENTIKYQRLTIEYALDESAMKWKCYKLILSVNKYDLVKEIW